MNSYFDYCLFFGGLMGLIFLVLTFLVRESVCVYILMFLSLYLFHPYLYHLHIYMQIFFEWLLCTSFYSRARDIYYTKYTKMELICHREKADSKQNTCKKKTQSMLMILLLPSPVAPELPFQGEGLLLCNDIEQHYSK